MYSALSLSIKVVFVVISMCVTICRLVASALEVLNSCFTTAGGSSDDKVLVCMLTVFVCAN